MADLDITIGNKTFTVACQDGQERFLQAAARQLSDQAGAVLSQIGRMPSERMLLMAGLMLADKTAAMEHELTTLRARVAELQARPAPAPERVEVPVIPPVVVETMAELAARTEALAATLEEKVAQ
ncbi:cell division protein ZapA [Falsirhodobacter algicola]|uniref:Cell division protein ZapA n=1 Tax=Falsirhodobacter algicola TaxID=2692330 RepID=A0A8J8MS20_9RHOB|nr:cell division protein ZapA [Falsirhodobacter algicola]QUS35732.1 cell division protein ZapA [Falsirhodobacter algicola]